MARSREEFAEAVIRRIRDLERSAVRKRLALSGADALQASAASTPPLGHPAFADLPLGASASTEAVAMFLDLRRFTARSFWDPPEQIIQVNVAVISELASAVEQHGGYVLGFRGDGVFACFDGAGQLDSRGVAGIAVGAAAWALDAVQSALNDLLKVSSIEPVQVRAGLDYGRLDFVRIGSPFGGSEVNVLGFAANFASKCEKVALAWEVIVGESMASLLPDDDLTHHRDSPTDYARDGQTRSYRFYDVALGKYLRHIQGVADELHGVPVSEIRIR
jgi:class 3 adenylate cyclase